MLTVIELTGAESREQCRDIAYAMFAFVHPHEAHAADPERFWNFFQKQFPNIDRETMERILAEDAGEQSRAE